MELVKLKWPEIALLSVIMDYERTWRRSVLNEELVSTDEAGENGLFYRWVHQQHIPRIYTGGISFKNRKLIQSYAATMRQAQLLERFGKYKSTRKALLLFEEIGTDWQRWPMEISVSAHLNQFTNPVKRKEHLFKPQ